MKWGDYLFMGDVIDSVMWPATIAVCVLVFAISVKKPLELLAQALLERQKAQLQKAETEHARWLEEKRLLTATFDNRVKDKNAELAESTAKATLAARLTAETADHVIKGRQRVIAAETTVAIAGAHKKVAAENADALRRQIPQWQLDEYDKYREVCRQRDHTPSTLGVWLDQLPDRYKK